MTRQDGHFPLEADKIDNQPLQLQTEEKGKLDLVEVGPNADLKRSLDQLITALTKQGFNIIPEDKDNA